MTAIADDFYGFVLLLGSFILLRAIFDDLIVISNPFSRVVSIHINFSIRYLKGVFMIKVGRYVMMNNF